MSARLLAILVCLPLGGLLLGSVHPAPRPADEPAHIKGSVTASRHQLQRDLANSDWPGWRGPKRDGHAGSLGLQVSWPKHGPKHQWTVRNLGHGYSSPAVVGDKVFVLGTDAGNTVAICLDLASGREQWRTQLGPAFTNGWGNGPRSTPTVSDGRVYVLTASGHLACLASESGSVIWDRWLPMHFGGEVPDWGYSESPLVDGPRVIVTPGIETPVVALDKLTGDVVWTARNMDDAAQYSSAVPMQIGSRRVYVNMTDRGLIALDAETGQLLCRYESTNNGTAVCPTPVVHGDYVFTTSGHGTGCGLVRLVPTGDGFAFDEVYFHRQMQNHFGVVKSGDNLFGYSERGGWTCLDFQSGHVHWQEADALDRGSLIAADGRLYLLGGQSGNVVLLEPTTDGWREAGRFALPEASQLDRGRGARWTPPVIAHGQLLLRDQELLFSFDLRSQSAAAK